MGPERRGAGRLIGERLHSPQELVYHRTKQEPGGNQSFPGVLIASRCPINCSLIHCCPIHRNLINRSRGSNHCSLIHRVRNHRSLSDR